MKGPQSRRKHRLPRVALLLLGSLLVLGVIWYLSSISVMSVTVSISTDEQGTINVYDGKAKFRTVKDAESLFAADIDLEKWEGKLVRLDIQGEVKRWLGIGSDTGFAGCSVNLIDPAHTIPMEFIGWQRGSSNRIHSNAVGSPAFLAPGGGNPTFVYGEQGSLWNVFRVPEKTALRVEFRPVLAKDIKGEHKPFVPSIRPLRLPLKKLSNTTNRRPPDVFIYLIDALRADHVGCYGYPRPTSPAIDAFAEKATLFENARCVATWTLPSTSTLISGLFPSVHDVLHIFQRVDRLDKSLTLLSEVSHEAGYKTALITTNAHTSEPFGFRQGIDFYAFEDLQKADWVNAQAAKFLAGQDPKQPVYMFLHTLEPHTPYEPKPETFKLFDRGFEDVSKGSGETADTDQGEGPAFIEENLPLLTDLYDAEILDNDRGFADFLNLLRRHGRYDDALIILIADHGESFYEHEEWKHGQTLSHGELNIPMIIRFPGGRFAGLRIKERVSLIDIYPTVSAQIGAVPQLDYHLPGIDLAELAAQPLSGPSRRIHAEVLTRFSMKMLVMLAAIIDEDGYKRVINTSLRSAEGMKKIGLWDTNADPKEQKDLTESLPVRAAYGEQIIAHRLVAQKLDRSAPTKTQAPAEMTDELREKLKALGYLD